MDSLPSANTKIRDVMTIAPYTVPWNMPAVIARSFMRDKRIRHLPVVDGRKLLGMVSDAELGGEVPAAKTVSELMTPLAYSVAADATLREVVHGMVQGKQLAAIVTDNSRPIGIFTTVDVLKILDQIFTEHTPPERGLSVA